jgi:hypothetical protein
VPSRYDCPVFNGAAGTTFENGQSRNSAWGIVGDKKLGPPESSPEGTFGDYSHFDLKSQCNHINDTVTQISSYSQSVSNCKSVQSGSIQSVSVQSVSSSVASASSASTSEKGPKGWKHGKPRLPRFLLDEVLSEDAAAATAIDKFFERKESEDAELQDEKTGEKTGEKAGNILSVLRPPLQIRESPLLTAEMAWDLGVHAWLDSNYHELVT